MGLCRAWSSAGHRALQTVVISNKFFLLTTFGHYVKTTVTANISLKLSFYPLNAEQPHERSSPCAEEQQGLRNPAVCLVSSRDRDLASASVSTAEFREGTRLGPEGTGCSRRHLCFSHTCSYYRAEEEHVRVEIKGKT